jgi:hypothetical protein
LLDASIADAAAFAPEHPGDAGFVAAEEDFNVAFAEFGADPESGQRDFGTSLGGAFAGAEAVEDRRADGQGRDSGFLFAGDEAKDAEEAEEAEAGHRANGPPQCRE